MGIELETIFENQKTVIIDIIKKHLKETNLDVSETIIENIAIHLSLNVSRDLNGTYISTSISQLKQLKNHEYYNLSKNIVDEISKTFNVSSHDSEMYYITMCLSQMNLFDIDFNCEFDIFDDNIVEVIDETIDRIQSELSIDIKSNDNFYKGITLHFFPAIERLQNDSQLTDNPLVETIENGYETEFKCANILNEIVDKYYHKTFNKHELAYIALHFGTAI